MCGSDEPTKHEPQTRCQKLLVRIQAVAFAGLAVYTIISMFQALAQVTRSELLLTETQPSDRCVPFFDDVNAFKQDNANTRAVYDFRAGEAITRICTNVSSADVRAALGADKAYDPWIAQTGCNVLGSDKQAFIDNCQRESFQAGDPSNCEDILNITPLPYGAHWNMYAELLTGNFTNTTTNQPEPYPACSIKVTRIPSISPCTERTMEPMRFIDNNVAAIIYIGIATPFIVTILQCIALWKYSKTWAAEDGWMLSFACRGIPGSFYMFYWVCNEGEDGRGEFPDTYFNFWGWLACAVQDAFEGLAVPLTAIVGCRLDRYPVNLILVVLKSLKFIFDFIMYLKNRSETSEPGDQAGQRIVWSQNPEVSQEELQKGVSLEGQSRQQQQPSPQPMYNNQQPMYNNQQPMYNNGQQPMYNNNQPAYPTNSV